VQSAYLANAALVEDGDVNLGTAHEAVRGHAALVSSIYSMCSVRSVVLGRTFLPGEDEPGRNQVAVISYGLWQQRFGGDRDAVGSSISVNGKPLTIIGVTLPGLTIREKRLVWQPAQFSEATTAGQLWRD
jgi:hypothetical protein